MSKSMCDCIKEVNESLIEAGHNTQLQIPITLSTSLDFGASKTLVATEKADRDSRQKPIRVYASYCPFCGVGYEGPTGEE